MIDEFIYNTLSGRTNYTNYSVMKHHLRDDVRQWLDHNNIRYKFNGRKARIKFYNDDDAVFFKLQWL